MSESCCIFVNNKQIITYMARPIKETPELYGEDAKRFERLISRPRPVTKEEKERARKAYEIMRTISNFQW